MAAAVTYHLGDFDGPLDLLLHLIKINEMDILDIPIVSITEQYLTFLHQAEQNDLDIAGEFLIMAATLMSIKARYLLPRPELELDLDNDLAEVDYEDDPREALIEQLLEYQRYQVAADELREREDARQLQFSRSPLPIPADIDSLPVAAGLELTDLQLAFSKMVQKRLKKQVQPRTMANETWSIRQQMVTVMAKLDQMAELTFDELFPAEVGNDLLVTTFLAMLDLVRHQHLFVQQISPYGVITLTKGTKPFLADENEEIVFDE